jgi:hypothetical protein
MRRQGLAAFAILGLLACGQRQHEAGPSSAGTPAPAGAASSAAPEAAKPDVGAAANPDVQSCLDLVANELYSDAIPACDRALRADAANDKLKAALATAQAKVAEKAAGAAEGAADAAKDAAGEAQGAADAAKDAAGEAEGAAGSVPAPPKTY